MFDALYTLFAAIGAGLILFALGFVTLLLGGLIPGMIVLISGPIIDRFVSRKQAGDTA
ncbi:MAG: hypothetical protein AB7I33_17375 [Gemmatimonadales bacterium]